MAEETSDGRHVLLLRGINVGGKNKLPMVLLTTLVTELGGHDVRTYIQSGNVVFTASDETAGAIEQRLPERILDRLGLHVPVVRRTAAELLDATAHNPFLDGVPEEKALHLFFLKEQPTQAQVAALDPDRSPGDRFAVRGRDVYLLLPNGIANSKLTNAYFDSKLKTVSTARNWRTVLTLAHMATS